MTQNLTSERRWWLRALAVLQAPTAVFAAFENDSPAEAEARQEPIIALVVLAGIAGILSTSATGKLLDPRDVDGIVVAAVVFLTGALYGTGTYWLGGGALYLGVRGGGGRTDYRTLRHLLAYAAAPLGLSLVLLWPLRIAVYGADLFRSGGDDASGLDRWLFEAAEAGFTLWSLALLILGVHVVHRWGVPRALGALAYAGFALIAVAIVPLLLAR